MDNIGISFFDTDGNYIKPLIATHRSLFVNGNGNDGVCQLHILFDKNTFQAVDKPIGEYIKQISHIDIIKADTTAICKYKVDRYKFESVDDFDESVRFYYEYTLKIKYIGTHDKLMTY